jgi:hypothetical protein
MALATHLGPWSLGTVNTSTGTTAGTVRNLGPAIVAQTTSLLSLDQSINTNTGIWLPAGSRLISVFVDTPSGVSGTCQDPLIAVGIGSYLRVASYTTPAIGGNERFVLTPNSSVSSYDMATWLNIGSTNKQLTAIFNTDGSSTMTMYVTVIYQVCNPDGSYIPVSTAA